MPRLICNIIIKRVDSHSKIGNEGIVGQKDIKEGFSRGVVGICDPARDESCAKPVLDV